MLKDKREGTELAFKTFLGLTVLDASCSGRSMGRSTSSRKSRRSRRRGNAACPFLTRP